MKPTDPESVDTFDGDPLPTKAEQLFTTLRDAILGGTIPLGSKISEPGLARRFGTSRGPLREALHRLQERRLIVRTPNQGARVVELSAEKLAELFVVREALEGMAARQAALAATEPERLALADAVSRHEASLDGRGNGDLANRDFHALIARASRNPLMIHLLCSELYPLLRLYRGTEPAEAGRRAFEEHRRILHAVEDRDPELAELLMRRHVAAARARRERTLAPEDAAKPGKAAAKRGGGR